jgi:hypothetical protein
MIRVPPKQRTHALSQNSPALSTGEPERKHLFKVVLPHRLQAVAGILAESADPYIVVVM